MIFVTIVVGEVDPAGYLLEENEDAHLSPLGTCI